MLNIKFRKCVVFEKSQLLHRIRHLTISEDLVTKLLFGWGKFNVTVLCFSWSSWKDDSVCNVSATLMLNYNLLVAMDPEISMKIVGYFN